jgi:hypothetical protein
MYKSMVTSSESKDDLANCVQSLSVSLCSARSKAR